MKSIRLKTAFILVFCLAILSAALVLAVGPISDFRERHLVTWINYGSTVPLPYNLAVSSGQVPFDHGFRIRLTNHDSRSLTILSVCFNSGPFVSTLQLWESHGDTVTLRSGEHFMFYPNSDNGYWSFFQYSPLSPPKALAVNVTPLDVDSSIIIPYHRNVAP